MKPRRPLPNALSNVANTNRFRNPLIRMPALRTSTFERLGFSKHSRKLLAQGPRSRIEVLSANLYATNPSSLSRPARTVRRDRKALLAQQGRPSNSPTSSPERRGKHERTGYPYARPRSPSTPPPAAHSSSRGSQAGALAGHGPRLLQRPHSASATADIAETFFSPIGCAEGSSP